MRRDEKGPKKRIPRSIEEKKSLDKSKRWDRKEKESGEGDERIRQFSRKQRWKKVKTSLPRGVKQYENDKNAKDQNLRKLGGGKKGAGGKLLAGDKRSPELN